MCRELTLCLQEGFAPQQLCSPPWPHIPLASWPCCHSQEHLHLHLVLCSRSQGPDAQIDPANRAVQKQLLGAGALQGAALPGCWGLLLTGFSFFSRFPDSV